MREGGFVAYPDYVDLAAQLATAQERIAELERDELQAIIERDSAEGEADALAEAIGAHLGIDIGEHSSGHCPWRFAREALEEWRLAGAREGE
jgi:hypothetical protein